MILLSGHQDEPRLGSAPSLLNLGPPFLSALSLPCCALPPPCRTAKRRASGGRWEAVTWVDRARSLLLRSSPFLEHLQDFLPANFLPLLVLRRRQDALHLRIDLLMYRPQLVQLLKRGH